eukprot:jgi/Galph1/2135/GphlegSOOS_G774.1
MNGQEIELSVEETNRLRAELGLKPLLPTEEKTEGSYDYPVLIESTQVSEQESFKERLDKQTQRRLGKSAVFSRPLGETVEDEVEKEELDAAAWVERSRKLEALRKAKPRNTFEKKASKQTVKYRQQPSTNDKVESSVENIPDYVVGATMEDLTGQEELVLTLRDKNVLDLDEDELENVDVRERQQALLNQRLRQAVNNRKRGGFDDSGELSSLYGDSSQQFVSILPKYDTPDLSSSTKHRLRLSSLTEKEREAVLRERVHSLAQELNSSHQQESVASSETRIQEDYFSGKVSSVFQKFRKQKSQGKKKKNKKSITAEELEEFNTPSTDEVIQQFDIDPEERLRKLQELRFKDSERSIPLKTSFIKTGSDIPNDESLHSLENGNREENVQMSGADRVLSAIKETESSDAAQMSKSEEESKETVVLDDLTEFVQNLDPHSLSSRNVFEEQPYRSSSLSVSPVNSILSVQVDEESREAWHETDAEDDSGSKSSYQLNDDNLEAPSHEEDDLVALGLEEKPVSMGVAAALEHLKMSGNLHMGLEQVGRTKDERVSDARQWDQGSKRIKLEYVDEFGRELTPKEAFRQLSYKFHGKGPGKSKQEKRLRKYVQELRSRMLASGEETPLHSVRQLKEQTKQNAAPFVILQSSSLARELSSRVQQEEIMEQPELRKSQDKKKQSTLSVTNSSLKATETKASEIPDNSHNVIQSALPEGLAVEPVLERGKIAIQLGTKNLKRKRPVLDKKSSFENV